MNIRKNIFPGILSIFRQRPHAWAEMAGSEQYPNLRGLVRFYRTGSGILVIAEIRGLPAPRGDCESPVFGFHIHEGDSCTGTEADPFANAKMHFNPHRCLHPHHAGDLPPLFGADGNAFSAFLTDRFTLEEIIGRTVIIHANPDDFTTQPSGNSGAKIACGKIQGGV